MDFRERLQRATQRGQQARDERAREAQAKALSEEQRKRGFEMAAKIRYFVAFVNFVVKFFYKPERVF